MSETVTPERAQAIYGEYVQWLRNTPESERHAPYPNEPSAKLPDALAHAAQAAMRGLADEDPRLDAVLGVYMEVHREYTKGWRCGVCGDADDPTYDHGPC